MKWIKIKQFKLMINWSPKSTGFFFDIAEVMILEIKVLTFNIHHGRGSDLKLNLSRIAEVIQESKADLIGLNEVDKSFSKRSGYMNQLLWLSDKLNMHHAFGASVALQSKNAAVLRQYGNALLSRYPIVFQQNHAFVNKGIFEGRSFLEADVQVQEHLLKIYVTHLSLNPLKQNGQVEFMLRKLEENRLPMIMLGDFNMRPGTKLWKKITNVLTDVCHYTNVTLCNTFPSFRPKIQLDYIFVSEHIRIDSVQVIKKYRSASDHIPIKATLKLE